jgi:hypothetical protein
LNKKEPEEPEDTNISVISNNMSSYLTPSRGDPVREADGILTKTRQVARDFETPAASEKLSLLLDTGTVKFIHSYNDTDDEREFQETDSLRMEIV